MHSSKLSTQVEQRILLFREQRVMLDFQLAELYQVETRALKQAVRRNPDRFPTDFMFELTPAEITVLVSQNVIPGLGKIETIEKKYDGQFRIVFDAIRQLMAPPVQHAREMGFHTIPNPKPVRKLRTTRKKTN